MITKNPQDELIQNCCLPKCAPNAVFAAPLIH